MVMKILKTELVLLQKNFTLSSPVDAAHVGFEVKFVSAEECKKIAIANKWQNNFRVDIDEIVKESNLCAVAEVNGNLAHWTQISFGKTNIEEIQKTINVDSDSAYLHGVYTAEAFRKKGLTFHFIEKISDHLCQKGISKLYILIDVQNSPMLKIAEKAGFKKLGKASLTVIGPIKFYKADNEIKNMLT
jgi:predicted GNAT family acetyltransferase